MRYKSDWLISTSEKFSQGTRHRHLHACEILDELQSEYVSLPFAAKIAELESRLAEDEIHSYLLLRIVGHHSIESCAFVKTKGSWHGTTPSVTESLQFSWTTAGEPMFIWFRPLEKQPKAGRN